MPIPDIETIFENDDFLVINKPAGLLVHGGAHMDEDTLADMFARAYPQSAKVGDDPFRPGVMHRLDRDACGLMVLAKSQESFEHLKSQFKRRTVKKEYAALVHGSLPRDEVEIDFPIARKSGEGRMAALPRTVKGSANEDGRQALTFASVKKRFINFTLLDVSIATGRTHQIRVHLSALGYPLVGDRVYGSAKSKAKDAKNGLGRLFLAALKLGFQDRSGQEHEFSIPLPEDLQRMLSQIK
jgi:23S rRNA pseudouridine1911/1915/1917 synthase